METQTRDRSRRKPSSAIRALTAVVGVIAALAATAAQAPAQGLPAGGCTLSLVRSNPTAVNVFYPDEAANYFVTPYDLPPGFQIRIAGRFPHARYMSWISYDSIVRPVDGIADVEIEPDAGSSNPYASGADRTVTERSYTVRLDPGDLPDAREQNTFYTGGDRSGALIYRIYVTDEGRDDYGDVALPTIAIEPEGATGPIPSSPCPTIDHPRLDAIHAAIRDSQAPPPIDGTDAPGTEPPTWVKFTNLPQVYAETAFRNPYLDPFLGIGYKPSEAGGSGGFFSNVHNSYLYTLLNRSHGRISETTMRVPTFPDTRPGPKTMPDGELRYFSMCTNEVASQRFYACSTDDQTQISADGIVRYVVSTPADRPATAVRECGVTWLPWGPATENFLIYRHMLADPEFPHSIQKAEPGDEAATMAEYFPVSSYYADGSDYDAAGCRDPFAGGAKRCVPRRGFLSASATAAPRGRIRVRVKTHDSQPVEATLFKVAAGRRVTGDRRIARFEVRGSFLLPRGGAGSAGYSQGVYFLRLTTGTRDHRRDVRHIALIGRDGELRPAPQFDRRSDCGVIRTLRTESPAFGGDRDRPLKIAYRLGRTATVKMRVMRGSRTVKKFAPKLRRGGLIHRARLGSRSLEPGIYRIKLTARVGADKKRATVRTRLR